MQDKMRLPYWKDQLDDQWLETMSMIHRGKSIETAVQEAFGYLICDEIRLQNSDISDFKRLVNGWLSKMRPEKKGPDKLKFSDL